MKFAVVGAGYVGLSMAILLSRIHSVVLLDISKNKVENINKKISPINDIEIEKHFKKEKLTLVATTQIEKAYCKVEYVIIATPTNYDVDTGSFDTASVEQVIKDVVKINKTTNIIIKSTVPLGFTQQMRDFYKKDNIYFSPEFLRESKALYDNLYPSRIVIGGYSDSAIQFAEILVKCSKKNTNDVPILYMQSNEAEAVKLFSNTFLAMRISFFNELDSFSETHDLKSEKIIRGVCADPRIGNYYNNPSFGYGGYCLPKDTKQLLHNFEEIPNNIIKAVVESNRTRKSFIVNSILKKSPKTIGVHRLVMKTGSDNFRESAILDIINELKEKKIKILIYEPFINETSFQGFEVFTNLDNFLLRSDIIIANRYSDELNGVIDKVYTRDVFYEN